MNQIISNKKTMLGIVLCMAIVAAIGTTVSVYADTQSSNITGAAPSGKFVICKDGICSGTLGNNGTMPSGVLTVKMPTIKGSININQLLMQSVKTKFVDAANTAQSAVTGGTVTGGELGPYQGYYVYNFQVLDSSGKTHLVIVDAGNGQVLSNTETPVGFSGMPGNVMSDVGGSMGHNVFYRAMSPAEGPVVIQTAPSQ